MPRRVCKPCDLSLPNRVDYDPCPVCGGETKYLKTGEPDADWQFEVEYAQALHVSPAKRRVLMWRRREFVSLGFAGAMLELLVESPVSPHEVAALIGGGCSVELAADILL